MRLCFRHGEAFGGGPGPAAAEARFLPEAQSEPISFWLFSREKKRAKEAVLC